MFRLIDKKISAFNSNKSPLNFVNFKHACIYADSKGIKEKQEFWFTIAVVDVL